MVDILLPLKRDPTALEAALLSIIELALSLVGAYVLGVQSTRDAAKELVRSHARSAFRRLFSLYKSLALVGERIEVLQVSRDIPSAAGYLTLHAIVSEQLRTAGDALEDWRDLIPEVVGELQAEAERAELNVQRLTDE